MMVNEHCNLKPNDTETPYFMIQKLKVCLKLMRPKDRKLNLFTTWTIICHTGLNTCYMFALLRSYKITYAIQMVKLL